MANIIKSKSSTSSFGEKIDMQFYIRETLRKYELGPTLSIKRSPLAYWRDRSSITEKSWIKKNG